VSLILDALRKLERDKQPRDPGVVVVGPVPWSGDEPLRRRWRVAALAAALAVALVAGGLWLRSPSLEKGASSGGADAAVPSRSALPSGAPPPGEPAERPAVRARGRGTGATSGDAAGGGADAGSAGPAGAAAATVATPRPVAPAPGTPPEPPLTRVIDLPILSPPASESPDESASGALDSAEPPPAASTRAPAPERELRLTAISARDGRPIALLNDRLVREGDSFDGVRVIRIGETEVEVEIDGKSRVIGF